MILFNMGLFSGFSLIFRTGEGVLSIKILEIMKGLKSGLLKFEEFYVNFILLFAF